MSMALSINVDRDGMLPLVATAINIIFNNPSHVFWTGSVFDLLYNGIEIDCTSTDLNVMAVCAAFDGGDFETITPIVDKEKFFKFSFFASVSRPFNLIEFEYKKNYRECSVYTRPGKCNTIGAMESQSRHAEHQRIGQNY